MNCLPFSRLGVSIAAAVHTVYPTSISIFQIDSDPSLVPMLYYPLQLLCLAKKLQALESRPSHTPNRSKSLPFHQEVSSDTQVSPSISKHFV